MSKRFLVPLTLPGANSLPAAGNIGDLFYKTDESAVYVFTNSGWAELAGGSISGLTVNRALISDANGDVATSDVTSTEVGHLAGVTGGVQAQLDGKEDAITGAATTITGSDLTANRAITSDSSGKIVVSATTDAELGHVSGVTSAIQTQINAKANTASPTFTGVILAPQIRLSNTTAASTTSTAQGLQVGSTTTGTRMKFGPNTLQVVTSTSSATTLEMQPNGGLTRFGGAIDTDVAQSTVNGTAAIRNVRVSTADPSGGLNGDVWLKYT